MAGKLTFLSRTSLLYGAATLFVVLPTMAMAVFGAWSLSALEDEPRGIRAEVRRTAATINERVRARILASLPKALPGAPGIPTSASPAPASAPGSASNERAFLTETTATALQRDYLTKEAAPFALACLTFKDGSRIAVATGPTRPREVDDPVWLERVEAEFETLRPLAATNTFRMTIRRGAGSGADEMLVFPGAEVARELFFDDDPEGGAPPVYGLVWLLDARRVERELKDTARAAASDHALSYNVIHQNDAPGAIDDAAVVIPLDAALFPAWHLAARVDETRIAGGAAWRSRVYIVFGLLTIPLLVGVIWFVVGSVNREIAEARKKVDFVANVTHELKTPLTSIRMFIEMILLGRTRSEEETRQSLEIVMKESERLARLIDRVLEFNKIEHHKKLFSFSATSLGAVVRETVAIFQKQMGERGEQQIKLAIESGLPKVVIDRDGVREVLLNLLSNAFKYSGTDKAVNVRLHKKGKWLLLDVIDQGQGIAPEEKDKIFEKFYRANDVLTRAVEGSGLGLTICQSIAKAHGGVIEVESTLGRGSCFTLKLPVSSQSDGVGIVASTLSKRTGKIRA